MYASTVSIECLVLEDIAKLEKSNIKFHNNIPIGLREALNDLAK